MWCFPGRPPPWGTWRSTLLFTSFHDVLLIPGRERSGSESQPNPPPQLAAGSTGGVLTTNEWKAPRLQFYSLELDVRVRCECDMRCACAERLAAAMDTLGQNAWHDSKLPVTVWFYNQRENQSKASMQMEIVKRRHFLRMKWIIVTFILEWF